MCSWPLPHHRSGHFSRRPVRYRLYSQESPNRWPKASFAHPGGNLTGFSNMEATFGEKWLELLKEIDPRVTRAAIMFNPQTAPITADLLHNVEAAAQRFAIQPIATPVRQISEIETAAAMLAREPGGGMSLVAY